MTAAGGDLDSAPSRRIPDWATTAERLRAEHRAILAAVDAREPERARTLIHSHITGYYAEAGLARDAPA